MQAPVYDKLYQFTALAGQMNLPVHQYLLATEPSVMFATGNYAQAQWILPIVDDILKKKPLEYLFISHMESDECGGLSLFLKKYPKLTIICSSFTANELKGFGFKCRTIIGEEGKLLRHGDVALKFFRYPAEVHMHDGLLVAEMVRGIFYSSDLMAHQIIGSSKTIDSEWQAEIDALDEQSIRDKTRLERLKNDLSELSPKYVAAGHGSLIHIGESDKL